MITRRSYRIATSAALFVAVTLLILFSYSNYHIRSDQIAEGYLDLSGRDLSSTIYSLDGEWKFVPGEYVAPTTDLSSLATVSEIKVPGSLYQLTPNKKEKILSGTYQLKIKVDQPGIYCLKTSLVSGAYRLYCNGELASEVGALGTSRATEKSVWQPKVCLLNAKTCDLLITVHVSNYNCRHGGLIKSLYFGTTETIYYFQTMQTIKSAIIIGIFLGLGIYLLLLTCRNEHRKTGFGLGVFCMGSALLEGLLDENLFFYFFKDLPLIIPMKGQFIACTILITSVFYFYKHIYPIPKWKKIYLAVEILNIIYLALLVLAPSYALMSVVGDFCTVLLVVNLIPHLIQIIYAIKRPQSYAWISLLSILVLFVLACLQFYFVDTGKSVLFYVRENLFIIGILFFLLCQINILLTDVDRAYQNAKLADSMEIAYLQAQISPHFMFNTLNNVSYLMTKDVSKAQTLLLQFCEFLKVKHKFDYRKQVLYTLAEELDFLKSYVAIENIRLHDAITLLIHVEDSVKSVKVMPLILQPLVENAIKHGYDSKPMTIEISVTQVQDAYQFTVKDNGRGMNEMQVRNIGGTGSKGVGISNINYRLEKYCGEKLHFESSPGVGTTIHFRYAKEGWQV